MKTWKIMWHEDETQIHGGSHWITSTSENLINNSWANVCECRRCKVIHHVRLVKEETRDVARTNASAFFSRSRRERDKRATDMYENSLNTSSSSRKAAYLHPKSIVDRCQLDRFVGGRQPSASGSQSGLLCRKNVFRSMIIARRSFFVRVFRYRRLSKLLRNGW